MKSLIYIGIALLLAACAVVSAIGSGLGSVGAWAGGIQSGSGGLQDGLQQGQWTFKGESGQTLTVGHYKDDVPDGLWIDYYPNGNKQKEGRLAEERRTGLWRYYHSSGFNKALGYFEAGREFGQWTFWDTRGQRSQQGSYLDGLQTGHWSAWHPDGAKLSEGWFLESKPVGLWNFWDSAGQVSQKDFGLPAGLELVEENWPAGGLRRQGMLMQGEQHGFWRVQHRDGSLRLQGSFVDGLAEGHWMAFAPNGERLAKGQMRAGRPSGTWTLWEGGGERSWLSEGSSPSMPRMGEWSRADLVASAGLESALSLWTSEAASALEPGARTALAAAPAVVKQPASELQLEAALVEPEIPISALPITVKERAERPRWSRAFTKLVTDMSDLASRYVRRVPTAPGVTQVGGDPLGAARYRGKKLPLTEFINEQGTPIFLDEMLGQNLVLVILRGYAGGVCVYCMEQTRILYESGALERFKQLDARLLVLYPGGENALEAFKAGFAALSSVEIPPYSLLYKHDVTVARRMQLEGDKVIPSTFILDAEGIVQFAYLGEHEADRPAVELLYQELEKISER